MRRRLILFLSFPFFFFCLFVCFCALRFEGSKEGNHTGIGEKKKEETSAKVGKKKEETSAKVGMC